MASKKWEYKWYRSGEYRGLLSNVISNDFNLQEQINTAGSQIQIELGISFENAGAVVERDFLVDENGDYIVTDALEKIILAEESTIEEYPSLNDVIQAYEYSDYYPDGLKVFEGDVINWTSSYKDAKTTITVASYGLDTDNYLVSVLPFKTISENTTRNDEEVIYPQWKTPLSQQIGVGQSFQATTTTTINTIDIQVRNGSALSGQLSATMYFYEGTPDSPSGLLGTVTRTISYSSGEWQTLSFTFAEDIDITISNTYSFAFYSNEFGYYSINVFYVGTDNTAGFSDGQLYKYNDTTGWSTDATTDMTFTLKSATSGVGNAFNSYDPSTIAERLIETLGDVGGRITTTDDSIGTTGTLVSYTFKYTKYIDALKKVVELSPSNWWWWIDPADNTYYLQPQPQIAEHTLTLGKDIIDINITRDITQVKNVIYFTGGDTGSGENLVANTSDQNSVERYGNRLELITDNRVTSQATADILMASIIDEKRFPRYAVQCHVSDTALDTKLLKIGDAVGFANFNDVVNSLVLQIVGKQHTREGCILQLEIIPPTVSKRVEDIRRNLEAEQTRNNPSD